MAELKKLKIEDLKIGMYVTSEQLKDIYNMYIFLDAYDKPTMEGEILYISEKPDDISEQIRKEKGGLCTFYQSKNIMIGGTGFAM